MFYERKRRRDSLRLKLIDFGVGICVRLCWHLFTL